MIFDYVIVGSGIAGLSCAYFLSKKKKSILVVDKKQSLNNASSAAAGLLSPIKFHTYPPSLQKLCIEAIKFYPRFLQELNLQHLIQSKGELILSQNENELKQIQLSFKKFNISSKIMDIKTLLKKFKYLSNNVNYGLLTKHVYSINNNLLLEKLLGIATNNAKILFSVKVNLIKIKNNKISHIETNVGSFEGRNFIFTTGAENTYFQKELFNVQVKGVKGVLLELIGNHKVTLPVIHNHYYVVPRNNYTLLAGTVVKENDRSDNVYVEYVEEIISNVKHFYSNIVKLHIKEIRTGLRPFIEGRTVIYERSQKIKNAYIINGLFRNGILLGPYVSYLFIDKYF